MIQITAVHMEGNDWHEHIGEMRWLDTATGGGGTSTREEMVKFVRQFPNVAFVQGPTQIAYLRVHETHPPYVQTYADNTWTDNLLSLPRY